MHRVRARVRAIVLSMFALAALPSLGTPALGTLALGILSLGIAVDAQQASPYAAVKPADFTDLKWRMIGPFRGGRTRAAAGVPDQPNVFYIGQADGGVWKTNDYGRTWNPIFDAEPSQSIGALAVAPSDSNVVYVASGEGLRRPDLSVGDGIYRSGDAGRTWTHLGLRDGQQIAALAVDPHDPNRLFAAVLGHPYGANQQRGIYRSTDGGASWKKLLPHDEDPGDGSTGGSDVEIDPQHPATVYASLWESRLGPWEDGNSYEGAHGGVYKSTDGGDTWRPITDGLPLNLVQINVAIAPSMPERLYATVATTTPNEYATGVGVGFYRSDDSGEHWTRITEDPRPAMKIGGGDLAIPRVDPLNPDIVYSTSIVTSKSADGGKTWVSFRGAPGGDDYQNMWINPVSPRVILLVSDQGAIVTVNGGESWGSWYNQPTAQLYHVAVTNTFPYKVCAGQQESGSVCISSRGNDGEITFRDWHPAGIIEYGYAAPDPLHPEIVYGAGRAEVSRYNLTTGQVQNVSPIPIKGAYRADRTEPILFSPVDPHRMYYAANMLFETDDGGANWKRISPDLSREQSGKPASLPDLPAKDQAKRRGAIYALAASYHDRNTLWAGTDDGLVWTTTDGGANWQNITPPDLIPWSKVSQLSASHFDDSTAYVSVSRLRIDDLHPFIYRTHDGGHTWQSIVAGLPDNAPVNTVREDPVRKGMLFAGTETGVYVSLDDGDHWHSLHANLPHTSMRDLAVEGDDLIVATHGRSFWIMDGISPLRQMDSLKPGRSAFLFTPGRATRVQRSTNTDTPLPPDEPAGQNPPDGAVLDYYLPPAAKGPISIEIMDAANQLVRRYTSTDGPETTPEALDKQLIPLYWIRMPKTLSAAAGMHRWIWDLRYAPPEAPHREYPISAVPHDTPATPLGPMVVPGTYTVRLTAGAHTYTAPLIVVMDPRVSATPADLEAQLTLETKLAAMVNQSTGALAQAHSLREQIAKRPPAAPGELATALKDLDKSLADLLNGRGTVTASGNTDALNAVETRPQPDPGLDQSAGDVATLYGQIDQADARPTAAQQQAATLSGNALASSLRTWQTLSQTSLVTVNHMLRSAHLPQLDSASRPDSVPQGGDED
ncbi:MAG TPA: glycoside hydrolase [Acidisarcina sp.]